MNLLPLCTSKVCPTNSGMIVHARAQVFRGCLARFSFSLETFRKSFSFTNGPFFALLLIVHHLSQRHGHRSTAAHATRRSCRALKCSRSADAAGTFRTCGDAGSVSLSSFWDYA